MGDSALEYAATWASLEGLEELLLQAGQDLHLSSFE